MRLAWINAVSCAVALFLIFPPTTGAAGLLEDQVDLSSVVLLGCTDPEICTDRSTTTTTELASQGVDTFTARLGLNVNAWADVFHSAVEIGTARYDVGFTVRSGGDYQLRLRVWRTGALRRSHSTLLCTGTVSLADMGAPAAVFNGDPAAEIPELALPGAAIVAGLFDADQAVPDTVGERVLRRTGNHGPDRYTISFSMTAVAESSPCQVSVRLGAPNGSTEGCEACEYPGNPGREISEDGLFVEVTVLDHCGNGVVEAPEQCDHGDANGLLDTCCSSECTLRSPDSFCRAAVGPCDSVDTCSATGECIDHKQPSGFACPDDGDACTTDRCNQSGECIHALDSTLCPERLCGNERIDPGETCDAGSANGAADSCCSADCKLRKGGDVCRPAGDECDPADVCDGTTQACALLLRPAGDPCADEGDFCTQDRCNADGQCTHTLRPELCPNLFCGNGQFDAGEECDLGDLLNGQPTSCCTADCKRRADDSPCNDGIFCNVGDHCTAGTCAGSPGNPCSALGSCAVCDEQKDLCDTAPCAALCGNGQLDGTEQCDLGKLENGEPTNCCGTDCRYRPDNSACTDQLFCNGEERCAAGVCGGSAGTPCSRACALCDEAQNQCDESACPFAPLPLQPTRELLIGEIFDGDGDRYQTGFGQSVRGTLDLDANGDLRFTAADLMRLPRCDSDAVLVGSVCIDKYEASVFPGSPGSPLGAQFGLSGANYHCREDGRNCPSQIFAYSLAGRQPSAFVTWFQAQQACASVGKRLPTNAEWQMAVAGTPAGEDDDATSCNTAGTAATVTGSRSACVSKWGVYDMVGNLYEWVAEWVPQQTACPGWGSFSDDEMCLAGANRVETSPGVLVRGGYFVSGPKAGTLAANVTVPQSTFQGLGFRCARAPR